MAEPQENRADNLRPGAKFLHYELLEMIGAGGQGVVWSAIDQTHKRVVAIKFSELTEAESTTFEGQAKNLVLLRHPNVLPLYDFGITNGMRFLVSLYAAGGSLQDRNPGDVLPIPATIKIAGEVAVALDYLHGQGIIHRDLKPGNVLMDLSGNAYLCDFGLARMVSTTTQAIHTGHGTPPYSPPEQHKMAQITTASDIYSFGVMLYELFTGQLPWNGEKSLGIQQLYSGEVLPDPREINPELPEVLAHILRRLTMPAPADRPKTAGEAMQWIRQAFHIPLPGRETPSVESPHKADAEQLLKQALSRWKSPSVPVAISTTKFALVNLEVKQFRELPDEVKRFMLYTSLAYGHDDQVWWDRMEKPRDRFAIATSLLERGIEYIAPQALRHLLDDPSIRSLNAMLPENTSKALLQMASRSENEAIKKDILEMFTVFTPAQIQWREAVIGPDDDRMLGRLALEDSDMGDEAARLIGHLRSRAALDIIVKQSDPDRRAPALVEVLKVAGDLPNKLPAGLRRSIAIQSVLERLAARGGALASAFGLAFLGAFLGFGLQVFVTVRLPGFLSIERFQIAMVPGLYAGIVIGLLILLIRVVAEFLRELRPLLRIVLATLGGGLLMSGAMVAYDILFLKRPPSGWLTPAACLLFVFGFAAGGNIRPLIVRMLLAAIAIFGAITGSWTLHRLLTESITSLTPFFTYEYGWQTWQILATAGGVALPLAIFGNLPRLVPRK